jgi:hypothetical protein
MRNLAKPNRLQNNLTERICTFLFGGFLFILWHACFCGTYLNIVCVLRKAYLLLCFLCRLKELLIGQTLESSLN